MSEPRQPRIIDPEIHAIFQAMLAYMGTTYTGMTCNITNLPNMLTSSATLRLPNNDSWQYTESSSGPRISVTPMSATLGPGGTQQFTATVTNADGTAGDFTVTWSVSGAAGGTVSASGLYTAPAAIAVATIQTVIASVAGFASTASVTVTLQP